MFLNISCAFCICSGEILDGSKLPISGPTFVESSTPAFAAIGLKISSNSFCLFSYSSFVPSLSLIHVSIKLILSLINVLSSSVILLFRDVLTK